MFVISATVDSRDRLSGICSTYTLQCVVLPVPLPTVATGSAASVVPTLYSEFVSSATADSRDRLAAAVVS